MNLAPVLLGLVCCLFLGKAAPALEPVTGACLSETGGERSGACEATTDALSPPLPEGSLQLLLALPGTSEKHRAVADRRPGTVLVYFFWGKGCPHCEEERAFLDNLKQANPLLEIRDYEVWYSREHAGTLHAMLQQRGLRDGGVPVTFVQDKVFAGFTAETGRLIAQAVMACGSMPCGDPGAIAHPAPDGDGEQAALSSPVTIPFLGPLDPEHSSLPLLTLAIAGMDSFNPCAFFVLLSLLGLLVHARSRNKMLLIGGIFVFFSGFIYFIFMAAWLNLFLVMGHVAAITTIAGGVSLAIAGINIKDFFLFKQGVSLTIPDSAKPKLFDRMRRLLRSDSIPSLLVGTTVLAIVANCYELLCTAGFPMVFTRILTLNNLTATSYYLYLVLYNIVYVVPLFLIVVGFTLTLGKRQLSEWQGRVMKLISGGMMLGLGVVLLVNPALLNDVSATAAILVAALGAALLAALLTRKRLLT